MPMTPKSNKPRGPVKMDSNEGSPVISKTANPQRAAVNQSQGPRSGNTGNVTKQKSFLAEKSDRSSYFQQIATMVTDAFGQRGQGMKSNRPASDDHKALKSISPDTKMKRGPTRGNQ
jgi:hypothetical protein